VPCNVATMLPLLVGGVSFCYCDRGRSLPRGFQWLSHLDSKARNCCRSTRTFPGLPRGKGMIAVIRIGGLIDSRVSDGDVEAPAVRTVLVSSAARTTVGRDTSDLLQARLSRNEYRWNWVALGAWKGSFGPRAVRPLVARRCHNIAFPHLFGLNAGFLEHSMRSVFSGAYASKRASYRSPGVRHTGIIRVNRSSDHRYVTDGI